MNVEKQINFWANGSAEDWDVAMILLEKNKIRQGLFFLHLAVEKLLKAHVTRTTSEPPPKIHNLVQLINRANLPFSQKQANLLMTLNSYCMEGRYAGEVATPPAKERAMEILAQTSEVRTWLTSLL